ncbi:hypothetical protein KY290_030954 [Solanum tuberosum]|uniref:Uncharacterized protein n=1 Tax=Solanum tuberosum TaxID=4113 RepID=A0ABQ7U7R8_SOLTU|nr:hypothetical protein KY290_030954 [Solanum tuberosum]
MEEDPEEDPRKPTEEMEEDLVEYSEHNPNLYDPRYGGVMHIEDEHVPTVENAHSEYGSTGFDEREDSNNWEWKINESSEYQPGTFYDLGDDDSQLGRRSSFFFEFPHKLLKRRYDLSLFITDIQNEEKMAHMEQELEILREELRQVRDLAKLSATTFLTFKAPIYFPKADLLSADLPNQPELSQYAPTHGRVPPASPTAVRTVPDLSNRERIIPTMQQILGAHVATPYEPYVPPVYTAGAPTFTMPAVVNVPYEVDQYEQMEKDARLKEDASINGQLQGLRKILKNLQVTRGTESLDYDDLCIHPDIDMPKKQSKNFQEYARCWRTEVARVQPPLDESELSKYFIRAQEGIYFDKMMSMMGQKFAELVKMGDFIEEGVKSGKIQSMVALQAASRAIQSGSIGGIKKKREDVSAVTYQP